MEIKTIEEQNYSGKKVFLRVDFNVPIENGRITDDTRITASLPTINYLLSQGAILIISSHLGRPKGKVVPEMSLRPVAERLSELLNKEVKFVPDCVGDEVKKVVENLKKGDVLLLENLRFHKEEEEGNDEFAKQLASLADAYVNDAFAACHREHASIYQITKYCMNTAAGFLIKKEVDALSKLLSNPEKPFLLIIGGAKVVDKIGMIKNLIDKVDTLITGGVMAYTFIKAKHWEIGSSKVDEEAIPLAKEIIKEVNKRHLEFHTPLDHIIVNKISPDAEVLITERGTIPQGWIGVDIGPQAIEEYTDCVNRAKTIFWNGPMGIFEIDKFAKGTIEIAKAVANSNAFSVIGGGDSIAAVNKAGVADKISHISTGGGASLEFLEKGTLPGIDVLKK
ncbi:MAG TPA: phosphoglycerate kinase [Candidatus Ratteibacteria bacterium]|nr:phosphoglycerate kinase [Candidatus Ratteibacteria bacterium]